MSSDAEQRRRRRRLRQIAFISTVLVFLVAAWFTRGAFSVRSLLGLDAPGDALTLYALSTLNFIALVTLTLVLVRHLLKLARERRERRLGAQFKTRMVVGSIALTLLPTAMLFLFSFWLIDSSLQIFLRPTQSIVTDAQGILNEYVEAELRDLHATARQIVRAGALKGGGAVDRRAVENELRRDARNMRIALIELRGDGSALAHVEGPDARLQDIYQDALARARAAVDAKQSYQAQVRNSDDNAAIFMVVGVPVGARSSSPRGMVVVRRFPPELAAKFDSIDNQQIISERLVREQDRVRMRYVATLSLVTLVVLFATVWIALFVSRGVTEPIQALVEATGEVAEGNLAYRIDAVADGELATLITSFNVMARQLEAGNQRLEERRAYIETVLASLSTGVVSLDESGRVTTVNAAAVRMLGLGPGPYGLDELGAAVGGARARIETLLRRARRSGSASSDVELTLSDGTVLPAGVSVTALRDPEGSYAGAVITVEDLTELIKAERTAAWNEVARRLAHEIKNPLTPIQLSAERIIRGFRREGGGVSDRFGALVKECTDTIVREVGALQHMVEEFSRYARMPQPRYERAGLNGIVLTTVGLYEGRLDGILLETALDPNLPDLELDPEQIQRVLVNLVDNAVEAVAASEVREIRVATRFDAAGEVVRVEVEDTGHGIDAATRDRLFLPYYSTRNRGTGLGLAIVSHIVADHRGRVWAEPGARSGARFVVEFPAAAEPAEPAASLAVAPEVRG